MSAELSLSPRRTLRHMAVLALAMAAGGYARAVLGPLQETMRLSLGLGDNQIAILQGAALAIPLSLLSLPLGLVADRHSRIRLLRLFVLLAIVGTIATAIADRFWLLASARMTVGIAMAGIPPAVFSLLADLFPAAQRGRASMMAALGQAAGTSAAFLLGGEALAAFGGGPHWRDALLWLAVPLAIALAALFSMREPNRLDRAAEHYAVGAAIRLLWRHRAMIAPLMVGWVMVGIGDVAALVWAAPLFERRFGLDPAMVGGTMSLVLLLSGGAGPVLGGLLADWSQRRGGSALSIRLLSLLALATVPLSFFPLAPHATGAAVALSLFMAVGGALGIMATTLCIVIFPNEVRALCVGLLGATGGLAAIALAPLLVSLLSALLGGPDHLGEALAAVGAVTALLGVAALHLGRRAFETAPPPASTLPENA